MSRVGALVLDGHFACPRPWLRHPCRPHPQHQPPSPLTHLQHLLPPAPHPLPLLHCPGLRPHTRPSRPRPSPMPLPPNPDQLPRGPCCRECRNPPHPGVTHALGFSWWLRLHGAGGPGAGDSAAGPGWLHLFLALSQARAAQMRQPIWLTGSGCAGGGQVAGWAEGAAV